MLSLFYHCHSQSLFKSDIKVCLLLDTQHILTGYTHSGEIRWDTSWVTTHSINEELAIHGKINYL